MRITPRLAFAATCLTSLGLLASAAVAQNQAASPALVIQGGTLIDGNGGAPVRDSVVVIQGDRITAAGRRGQVRAPAGATVINAAGKYLVPGLIDAKTNYASNYGEAYPIWGVTTAVLSGGSGDAGIAERDAINHGMFPGPRLFTSYAAIAGPGADGKKQDNGVPGRYPYIAHTPEEARQISRNFLAAGADFLSAADGDGAPEIFKSVMEEAQAAGVAAVMRTVGPGTRANDTAAMGPAVLIHTGEVGVPIAKDEAKWKNYIALPPDEYSDMDDAKAAAMVKFLVAHKAVLEPDLIAADRGFSKNLPRIQRENATFFDDQPALAAYFPAVQRAGLVENVKDPSTYMDPAALEVRRRGFVNHTRFLKMFVDAGGHIVPASDDPQSPPGLGVHQEMAVFEEDVGLTPMQALQSATKWAADAFMLKDLGVIAPGKLADVVIVNDDPTKTVLNLRKIDTVIKDGKLVDRTYHPDYLSKTFRVGLYEGGSCCFSSPVVEQLGWVAAVKQATWNPNARNGGFGGAGDLSSELAATPGIESIFPYTVPQGSPGMMFTVRGFNFSRNAQLTIDGRPVPAKVVSRTELQANLDPAVFAKAGKYKVRVKNPGALATPDWGDTSNVANLLVPYSFTAKFAQNRF